MRSKLLMTVASATLLAGCGAATPRHGGTLTVLEQGPGDTAEDPAQTTFGYEESAIFRTLYLDNFFAAGRPPPDLATGAPEIAADHRSFTVHIRSGVRFSPPVNREVTAADVKYGIERGFLPTVASPSAYQFFGDLVGVDAYRAGRAKDVVGLQAPNRYTLVFHLRRPVAPFVSHALTLPLTAPVPREYAARFDRHSPSTYAQHVVATGPYMVARDRSGKPISTPGLSLRLIRNPNWRRDTDVRPAYLDEIDFRGGYADPRVLVDKVLGGRASVTSNFPPPPPVLQSVLSGPHRRQLSILEGSASLLLELNTTIPPLTDANVRLAIAAALDRRRMSLLLGPAVTPPADHYLMPRFLKAARQGGAAVAAPPVLADPAGSLALAHAYLRRAGYPSGRYTGSARLRFVGIAVEARPVTDLIDLELRSLGFKLDTTAVPPEVAFERCGRPRERVAMCFGNSVAIFDDPETMLGQFAGSQIKPESNPDPAQLNDPTVNAAIARASVVSQAGARARAWAGVERLILARMPAVPLVYENLPYFRSADVQDFVNGYTGLSDACWMRLARG